MRNDAALKRVKETSLEMTFGASNTRVSDIMERIKSPNWQYKLQEKWMPGLQRYFWITSQEDVRYEEKYGSAT